MKPCHKYRKSIALLAMNALDEQPTATLNSHFGHCQACQRYYQELRSVAASVNSLPALVEASASASGFEFRAPVFAPARRNFRRILVTPVPRRTWLFALPALSTIAVVIVLVVVLHWHPVPQTRSAHQVASPSVSSFSPDLAPTVANYQAVLNESLDDFDQLLTLQCAKPIPTPVPFTAGELALAKSGE